MKYEMPMWYFNLNSELSAKNNFFVDYRSLAKNVASLLDISEEYDSEEATLSDAAYQIIQSGLTISLPSENIVPLELDIEYHSGQKGKRTASPSCRKEIWSVT